MVLKVRITVHLAEVKLCPHLLALLLPLPTSAFFLMNSISAQRKSNSFHWDLPFQDFFSIACMLYAYLHVFFLHTYI